jgi:hypothetical protein
MLSAQSHGNPLAFRGLAPPAPSDREKSQLCCSATCNIDKQDAIVDDEQFKLGADLEKAIPWQIFVLPFGVPFLY